VITRAPKRKRETGDRRAKRAQANTGMAPAAKSPPKAIPVPTMAKRQSVAPQGEVPNDR
jgi:hypothetical protein